MKSINPVQYTTAGRKNQTRGTPGPLPNCCRTPAVTKMLDLFMIITEVPAVDQFVKPEDILLAALYCRYRYDQCISPQGDQGRGGTRGCWLAEDIAEQPVFAFSALIDDNGHDAAFPEFIGEQVHHAALGGEHGEPVPCPQCMNTLRAMLRSSASPRAERICISAIRRCRGTHSQASMPRDLPKAVAARQGREGISDMAPVTAPYCNAADIFFCTLIACCPRA